MIKRQHKTRDAEMAYMLLKDRTMTEIARKFHVSRTLVSYRLQQNFGEDFSTQVHLERRAKSGRKKSREEL